MKNLYHRIAEEVQETANALNKELGRFDSVGSHLPQVEITNHMFTAYLYESLGIEVGLSYTEMIKFFGMLPSRELPQRESWNF